MTVCWEMRGCDDEMQSECPHAQSREEMCPTKCAFAGCDRPQHELTTDPALIFSPDVDREAAIKQTCLYCAHFLTRGPRIR